MPCLRIDGNTSVVTQRRNADASGLSDRIITSYIPGSVTTHTCCVRPSRSGMGYVRHRSSARRDLSCDTFEMPKAAAKSASTNNGSPDSATCTRTSCPVYSNSSRPCMTYSLFLTRPV
nr:MAG TPA: hypothetical protein [Caudoviricetes sp.]